MKEITVNLKNLVYRILLGWRMILILGLVCALIGNCYGAYSSYKAKVKKAKQQEETVTVETGTKTLEAAGEDADDKKAELTIREIKDVDAAIKIYSLYEERFKELQNYLETSVLMQLDYKNVSTGVVTYYIDEPYVVEYPVIEVKSYANDIAEFYSLNLLDEKTLERITEESGISAEDIRDLVVSVANSDIITITVIGPDEETCKKITGVLKERMQSYKPNGDFGEYTVSLVSEEYFTKMDDDVYSKQIDKINDLNSIRTSRASIQNNMTDGQKKYFLAEMEYQDLLKNSDNAASDETGNAGETENASGESAGDSSSGGDAEGTVSGVNRPVSVKFSPFDAKSAFIGFVAGIMLGCFIIIFSYILTPVVRTKENLVYGLKQTVLGTVWVQKDKKKFLGGIDKLITKWFYGRETAFETGKRIEMLCAGIRVAMDKEGIQNLFVTGASEKGNEVIGKLKEGLGEAVSAKSGDCIVYSPESLKEFSSSDAVVWVETVGDSRYEEISKELELATQSKVKVLGFVLVQE